MRKSNKHIDAVIDMIDALLREVSAPTPTTHTYTEDSGVRVTYVSR